MSTTEGAKRCDNLACLCNVPARDAVCSPYCASPEARDAATITCSCGHPACMREIDEQLHGGIGKESL